MKERSKLIACPRCGSQVWTRRDGMLHAHRIGGKKCGENNPIANIDPIDPIDPIANIASAGVRLHEAERRWDAALDELDAARAEVVDARKALAMLLGEVT